MRILSHSAIVSWGEHSTLIISYKHQLNKVHHYSLSPLMTLFAISVTCAPSLPFFLTMNFLRVFVLMLILVCIDPLHLLLQWEVEIIEDVAGFLLKILLNQNIMWLFFFWFVRLLVETFGSMHFLDRLSAREFNHQWVPLLLLVSLCWVFESSFRAMHKSAVQNRIGFVRITRGIKEVEAKC